MTHAAILSRALPAPARDRAEISSSSVAHETGFSGVWQNEPGCTLALSQYGSDLSGSYFSAPGDTQTAGDVVGTCQGDMISFSVHWREFQAITSWTGRLTRDGTMLQTLWHMVTETPSEEEREDIHTGADRFTRLANIVHLPGLNG